MWFNLLIVVLVIVVPAIWSTKAKGYGAFSALLAAVCSLAAGGIAFAFWEPFSYMILGWGAGMTGFMAGALQGSAFGLGLAVPYIGALLVLRLLLDSLVKGNLDLGDTLNMAGGALFGLVTSVISVGIFAISVGYLSLPHSVMGYAPIEERNGQVVYASKLWIPVDLAVTRLYESLSEGAFGCATPLAVHQPNLHEAAGMQRMTYHDASRNTLKVGDFEVLGAYAITGAADELSKDSFLVDPSGQAKRQTIIYPDGSSPTGAATLVGYAIRFTSGAKEKGGNVIVTPGQLRLLCLDEESGESIAIHPIAVVAPPEAGAVGLYRFRFDAPESFIASQGGGADTVFAFEFMLRQGLSARTLLVKNFRVDLESDAKTAQPKTFPSYQGRDGAIKDGSILSAFGVAVAGGGGPLNKSGSKRISKTAGKFDDVEEGTELPNGANFSRNNKQSLELNEKNEIIQGEANFKKEQLSERGIDKLLRVERFASSKDTGIIKIALSKDGTRSVIGRGVEAAESSLLPVLVDERGATYEPVGFVYGEADEVRFKYAPGTPLRSLADAPALSKTKRDQTMYLIFRPTKGVKIVSFAIGGIEIASFPDGLLVR